MSYLLGEFIKFSFMFRASACPKFRARRRMQAKYLEQIYELYEDFSIVEMPLLDEEVRGLDAIGQFSDYLLNPYALSDKGRGLTDSESNLADRFFEYFQDESAQVDPEELIETIRSHHKNKTNLK